MKLRNFKDDFIYFRIFGMLTDNRIIPFNIPQLALKDTLKECVNMIHTDEFIQRILNPYRNKSYNIAVIMDQYSHARSVSYSDNILYYACKGVFYFSKLVKLYKIDLDLRKTIDPSLQSITIYTDNNSIYYNDSSVIARKYFRKTCKDKELSKVLLNKNLVINY